MARASLPRKCKQGPSSGSGPNSPGPGARSRPANKRQDKRPGRQHGHQPGRHVLAAAAKAMEKAVGKPTPGPSAASGSSPLAAASAPAGTPAPAAPIDEPLRGVSMEQEMGFALRPPAYDYGRRDNGSDFLDQWKSLSIQIMSLSLFFPAVTAWDSLDIKTREWLLSWAPNAQATLANRFHSCSIWEGWLWRLLVDRVFLGHDGEVWQGYGALSAQFTAVTNRPPEQWDVSKLGMRLGLEPECPHDEAVYYIRKHEREWHALTARLCHVVTGHEFRFPAGHLSGLVENELGRYLLPKDQQPGDLATLLKEFDATALSADRNLCTCAQRFRFSFTHPETGEAFGFPYRYLNPNPSKPPKDSKCVMLAYATQTVNNDHCIGHPVDHVVRPYLSAEVPELLLHIPSYIFCGELPMRVVINEDRVLEAIFGKQDGVEQPEGDEDQAEPDDGAALEDEDTVE